MSDAQRHARVPAEMSRDGWARSAGHVATAGGVTGRGKSAAAALDDLAAALGAMAGRAAEEPTFWWDADNRALHVAVPDVRDGGHSAYIVMMTDTGPYASMCKSAGCAPASEALTSATGMERVPQGRRA